MGFVGVMEFFLGVKRRERGRCSGCGGVRFGEGFGVGGGGDGGDLWMLSGW